MDFQKWGRALAGFGAGVQGNGPQYLQGIQQQKYFDEQMQRQRQEQRSQDSEQVKRKMAQEFMVAYQSLNNDSPQMAIESLRNITNTPLIGQSPAGQIAAKTIEAVSSGDPVAAKMAAKQLEPVIMAAQARGYFGNPDAAKRPASVEEWEYYKSLSKEDQAEFRRLQGSGYLRYDDDSRAADRANTIQDIQATAQPQADAAALRQTAVGNVETAQAVDRQEQLYEQERGQQLAEQQPAAESRISAKQDQVDMLKGLIGQARDMAGAFTVGTVGAASRRIPGTPAYDLNAQLDTIRANIGFDKLQEMRDNSPTGGALGQVSEMENRLLQSTWGNLQQSQSKEQFLDNLERLERQIDSSWERVERAYEQTYGVPYQGDPAPAGGNDLQSVLDKYGY